jgi:hypothetical protein
MEMISHKKGAAGQLQRNTYSMKTEGWRPSKQKEEALRLV